MKYITFAIVTSSILAFAGCKKDQEQEASFPEGSFKVICKNESGQVVLSAVSNEKVERLKNGGVRFKDANGSYIIGKGECQVK